MGYRSLRHCVADLRRHGHLVECEHEVDGDLEVAEIHRRVFANAGPAVYYPRVRGCQFPLLSNLYGSMERVRFIFRDRWEQVRRLIEVRANPALAARHPTRYWRLPWSALSMLPRYRRGGSILDCQTTISELPAVRSWPLDGGPFILLPAVYTEHPERPGWMHSNLGMYRIQLSGNEYRQNEEVGLHYQLHRGIGIHHTLAQQRGEPLRVNIFVGGSPAMAVAAVMPLPEGMSELTFAGALAGHRIPLIRQPGRPALYADADFCICGTVLPDKLLPEGPFGDHLGYYSLTHEFPVLRVDRVYHRQGAIWPFTIVGRPPQEDTMFGRLIHELTGPMIPTVVPGVHAVHAVDAAGVHPLMLAIGSERYAPFLSEPKPRELLTQANAILGHGQMSLAKYLVIVARHDAPDLHVHDVLGMWDHLLRRIDFTRDLHFQTCTTIDTLDYSGSRLNEGSKVVFAATGPPRFTLSTTVDGTVRWPAGTAAPEICLPGVVAVTVSNGMPCRQFCEEFAELNSQSPDGIRMIILVDDSRFTARSLGNWLWVTFTRSNPAADIDGVGAFTQDKHWGCTGPLVIDARVKPHHAPTLQPDVETVRRVDALAARGGPLARWL